MKAALLITLGLLVASATAAFAGQEGHGGDPLAAEFVTEGRAVLTHLRSTNDLAPDVTDADLDLFEKALETTRVDPTDTKLFDHYGDDVEARVIADPLRPAASGMLIQINREAFLRWIRHGAMLHRLVLHEYLWVIGRDDENYRISSKLESSDLPPILSGGLRHDICRGY